MQWSPLTAARIKAARVVTRREEAREAAELAQEGDFRTDEEKAQAAREWAHEFVDAHTHVNRR